MMIGRGSVGSDKSIVEFGPLLTIVAPGAQGGMLANPKLFRLSETGAYEGLKLLPHFLVYNKLINAWGKHREMPPFAKKTFHDWYLKNRNR